MQDGKREIRSLLPGELEAELKALGLPGYRAKQVFRWLMRGAASFGEMTDLPRALRETLEEEYRLSAPAVLRRQESADGTVKYLWRLWDGNAVESVVMRYHYGNTVCVSSQVGCRQGCVFCASSGLGLVRDLSAGEMLEEVLYSGLDSGAKITGIVLMGIGEPLENYDNVPLPQPGERSRGAEHRHAAHLPFHLRPGAPDRAAHGGGPAAHPLRLPPRPGR